MYGIMEAAGKGIVRRAVVLVGCAILLVALNFGVVPFPSMGWPGGASGVIDAAGTTLQGLQREIERRVSKGWLDGRVPGRSS